MGKTDPHPAVAALLGILLFTGGAWPAGAQVPTKPELATRPQIERSSPSAFEEPIGELTLNRARDLALAHNAELSAYARGFNANEAAVDQAGVLPNPVLGAAAQNLGNSRLKEDGDRASVLQIEQMIELGGKRAARIRLAETGRDLAAWDFHTRYADLILRVSRAFIDVLAGQQRQSLSEGSLALTRQFADSVSKRVEAGKTSPVEETRAKLSLYAAQAELERARRELAAARQQLAALWNNPAPRFEKSVGDLDQVMEIPDREHLFNRARENPDLARWKSEIAQAEANVSVAKAKAVPDLTLSGSVARFSQFNDTAYTVGISIPIPLFDRNRSGVLEASRLLHRARDLQLAAESRVYGELAAAEQRMAGIRAGIEALRDSILPGAQSAFDATRKGYELGKFAFIDVVDAERTLVQVRSQYLDALADYQRGVREIERLIGGELAAETPTGKRNAGDSQ